MLFVIWKYTSNKNTLKNQLDFFGLFSELYLTSRDLWDNFFKWTTEWTCDKQK